MSGQQFTLDGKAIRFKPGDTIMDAALRAGHYLPHLCHHPGYTPHGSCRLCVVSINGRLDSACTRPAENGLEVTGHSPELRERRRHLLQMLFVEGNHICPACEKSGDCRLQALAYDHGMLSPDYKHFFENRAVDASHPDFLIDYNRCIVCELCVRASRDHDAKNVFLTVGRGIDRRLTVNSPNQRLAETDFCADDAAADICPVGAILPKHVGYRDPIGQRRYDLSPIHVVDPDLDNPHEP